MQSYGQEARARFIKSEVIINNEEINFPKIINLNILVCLTEKSLNEYLKDIDKDDIIIADSSIGVKYRDNTKFYKFPVIESSKEAVGSNISASMVALGVISGIIKEIDKENIKKSIIKRVPKGTEKLNITALKKELVF
ncbi:2-oxoacid:acceptor oxidoreductase family protein [Clostridium sp. CCUG 7971]|uniref:2-oxoacid:acceptor oxidoreductase family protein n=1 Tax=Clostridium sp. CCUG 7971 TaxID=2811414 RepID=UPI001ABABA32|nr:2-oxoacid:acceptor oxidoreductase family protein [Clostridium sp. CCUG 7971]